MTKQKVTCVLFTILVTCFASAKCQQTCDVLSPVKMSPLDTSAPFVVEQIPPFEFNFDKNLVYKVSLKSNVVYELSDKSVEDSPTFSGGRMCVTNDTECVFRFERFAFNWKISEAKLSDAGKEYPLESHLLFVNQK